MRKNEEGVRLDDVLNEWVAEDEKPTAESLKRWVGRYPQYRRELVEFAAAWAEQTLLPPAPGLEAGEEERIVDRVMSHALNVSFNRDGRAQCRQPEVNAIKSLTSEARSVGLEVAEFAKACGLDLALVTKLNNRMLKPETIPSRLVAHIGRLLGRTTEGIMDYLRGQPAPLVSRSFLSHKKPHTAQRQSFADAVRGSSLSKAERARWLDKAVEREEG
jgi:hypothetical protein